MTVGVSGCGSKSLRDDVEVQSGQEEASGISETFGSVVGEGGASEINHDSQHQKKTGRMRKYLWLASRLVQVVLSLTMPLVSNR